MCRQKICLEMEQQKLRFQNRRTSSAAAPAEPLDDSDSRYLLPHKCLLHTVSLWASVCMRLFRMSMFEIPCVESYTCKNIYVAKAPVKDIWEFEY